MSHTLYAAAGEQHTLALLDENDRWGIRELDLVAPPARFWADGSPAPRALQEHVDAARVPRLATPAQLLLDLPAGEGWIAHGKRSLRRLEAWFLIVEDPQRRLDARPVDVLAHQVSLVRHVMQSAHLERVLIADEVGLGKTIEAGTIIKELIDGHPQRVLYLAPAQQVRNVHAEFQRLELPTFRKWVTGTDANAQLDDAHIIASIHRATHPAHMEKVETSGPWDVIVVDECHHLTDWGKNGGNPVKKYQLVEKLLATRLAPGGRALFLSGTPHQGHHERFKNLLKLLRRKGEPEGAEGGRVIYRTKDDVFDWEGNPLFPRRQIEPITVVDLGARHRAWLDDIHEFYVPTAATGKRATRRAAGWRCAQALQWAASSIQAGLGYLVRQAIRADWSLERGPLRDALGAIRPYRNGRADEPLDLLFGRISKEILRQRDSADLEDIEEEEDDNRWVPDAAKLTTLLREGVAILRERGDDKWLLLWERILAKVGDDKVVLFAQPIETVTSLRDFLKRRTGKDPAVIIGDQDHEARQEQIDDFWRPGGPQFLVSSRAGGEGVNLQCAWRLVHVDVPWNPMELEQRVGRVHRIGSRRTIVVDTLVVKDSREAHAYAIARRKLNDIVNTLDPERFEALFNRVMSLVPPTEFMGLMGESAFAPLNDDEQRKIAELVTRGFKEWNDFDARFKAEKLSIASLDAGQATWADVRNFCVSRLKATEAEGFTALRFRLADNEIRPEGQVADVLTIEDACYACGDYSGVPVISVANVRAPKLGLNIPVVARRLRDEAFPGIPTGAAHLGWKGEAQAAAALPFGVLLVARQAIRFNEDRPREVGVTLHGYLVRPNEETIVLDGQARGALVRGLLAASPRAEPTTADGLRQLLLREEGRVIEDLRRPGEQDRVTQTRYAVTPLLAAVVS